MWFNEEDLFEDDYDIPDEDDEYAGLSDEDVFESDEDSDFILDVQAILSDKFDVWCFPIDQESDQNRHQHPSGQYLLQVTNPQNGDDVTIVIIDTAQYGRMLEVVMGTGHGEYDTIMSDQDNIMTDVEELMKQHSQPLDPRYRTGRPEH